MGKTTDKLYITQKEYSHDMGKGKKERDYEKQELKTLPFYCCHLSFQPFEDPVCTPDGTIYDIVNIVPWLKKYKNDPITGKPLAAKDLIKLNFYKNAEGKFHCPITYKEFTDFTHIVAIRQTGNVYSYDAVKELNITPKYWKDLISGEPFTKKDIITLQDPNNLEKRNTANFFFVQKGLTVADDTSRDPLANIRADNTAKRVIEEYRDNEQKNKETPKPEKTKEELKAEERLKERQKTFRSTDSAAFTSSVYEPAKPKLDEYIPKKTKKKGFVSLVTNKGTINLMLHCDLVPRTCENFLTLCERGYYNNTKFHRSIRNFMVQGGDPTGTGRGGESIWGKKFRDEFHPKLRHEGRGVLSMANSGKNTNGSQFFITFKSAKHLDNHHTVFGQVVGGMDVLKAIEDVPTDDSDRPLEDIILIEAQVFINPFSDEEMAKEREEEEKLKRAKDEESEYGQWYSNPQAINAPLKTTKKSDSVGKYLQTTPNTNTNTNTNIKTNTTSNNDNTKNNTNTSKFELTTMTTATETKKRTIDFSTVVSNSPKSPPLKKSKTGNYGDFSKW